MLTSYKLNTLLDWAVARPKYNPTGGGIEAALMAKFRTVRASTLPSAIWIGKMTQREQTAIYISVVNLFFSASPLNNSYYQFRLSSYLICHSALVSVQYSQLRFQDHAMSHLTYTVYEGYGERATKDYGYSQAVRIGDMIHLSGQGMALNILSLRDL